MPEPKQRRLFPQGAPADGGAPVSPAGPLQPGVAVREVACRSLLNRAGIDDYSFNCYTGCGHGCVYCYARFMQRFHPHDEPWGRFVDVKVNAADVLARQLRRMKPGSVFTCSACDGWQPVEAHYRLTRQCCRLLLAAGFRLNVLTKSALVLLDLDLFAGRNVRLGVTITTPDEDTARLWEPHAASVADRLRVLKEAKQAGLDTAVMFGPLLPGVSDDDRTLADLFDLARQTGVDHVWTDAINPRPRVWPSVQAFLRRQRPDLLALYRRVLFEPDYRDRYTKDLRRRLRRAAAAAGLADRMG